MSKVYKSSNVIIGSPKTIINSFRAQVTDGEESNDEVAAAMEEKDLTVEETANTIIDDAKQMYLKIIEEANSEAKSIVERANVDAENLRFAAKEEGFQQGYTSGYEEGKRSAEQIIKEASEICMFLDNRKSELYREVEEDIINMVIDISKKVIGEEIQNNQGIIIQLIKQAMEKCTFKNKLILRVSPMDFNYVAENNAKIVRLVEGISGIEVVEDSSLDKGGCIIETESGMIDASAKTQIKELEKALLFTLRNE